MPTVIKTLGRGSLLCCLFLMAAMVSLWGCRFGAGSEAAPTRLPVKMVWAGHQGGGPSPMPSVQWIHGPDALDGIAKQDIALRAAVARSGMDWSRYTLVWIRMGQQRTGGFGLRLAASEAVVRKGLAVVSVHWRRPPKGAFVTQMITSPAMVLKLPRGDYQAIVIKDQAGGVRARASLP